MRYTRYDGRVLTCRCRAGGVGGPHTSTCEFPFADDLRGQSGAGMVRMFFGVQPEPAGTRQQAKRSAVPKLPADPACGSKPARPACPTRGACSTEARGTPRACKAGCFEVQA